MATITAPGIGSGLDVSSIISQLMALEERPIIALQQREAGYQAQLSALGQLRSAVSSYKDAVGALKSFSDFNLFKATSADKAIFTATAGNTAAVGTYDIEVQSLAKAEKQGSAVQPDSDTTTFGNAGDKMKIVIGASSFTVDTGAKTLSAIASAINDAPDNIGVTASIIQETASQYYLVVTSDNVGVDNAMTISFEDSGGTPVADPLTMGVVQAASDAQILVDNTYTIQRSTNTITDAFEGVTLNLLDTSASAVNLAVTKDTSSVSKAVSGFVDAYNSLRSSLSELGSGNLMGDSTIRLIESRVRSIINTPPSGLTGSFSTLSEIGISFLKDGTLTLDSSKLNDAIGSDLNSVSDLFANDDQGYAFRLYDFMDGLTESDGLIDAREDGINARIEDVQESVANLQVRLVSTERRLRAQYTALDSAVANMQATSNFLTQQLQILSNLIPSSKKS